MKKILTTDIHGNDLAKTIVDRQCARKMQKARNYQRYKRQYARRRP
jgi:hypothetical protein